MQQCACVFAYMLHRQECIRVCRRSTCMHTSEQEYMRTYMCVCVSRNVCTRMLGWCMCECMSRNCGAHVGGCVCARVCVCTGSPRPALQLLRGVRVSCPTWARPPLCFQGQPRRPSSPRHPRPRPRPSSTAESPPGGSSWRGAACRRWRGPRPWVRPWPEVSGSWVGAAQSAVCAVGFGETEDEAGGGLLSLASALFPGGAVGHHVEAGEMERQLPGWGSVEDTRYGRQGGRREGQRQAWRCTRLESQHPGG